MADGESSQEEDTGGGGSVQKRVAKKKHYPFGTPSHTHHPFSEFAHLQVDTRSFALGLATATDIKPEVVEEEPKKRRHTVALQKPKAKKHAEDDDEDDAESKSKTEASDLAPCTKIGCQLVIRAIADIEYKNEIEKLDLEDEYEKLVGDLKALEADLHQSEQKLEKMSDFGNQLEIKFNQIMNKVEQGEKTKEHLAQERTEINTKLMLIEVERQKANRRFDKAQKQLSNARWRKKKQAQSQDVEAGLSLPVSEITENKILHIDEKTIQKQLDIYATPMNQLAYESNVDLMEKAPPIKTVPKFLQTKFFQEPEKFDKYSKTHYEKVFHHSLDSWKNTEGTLLANSVETVALLHPSDPSSQRLLQKKLNAQANSPTGGGDSFLGNEDFFSNGGSFTQNNNGSLSPKSFNPSISMSSLGLTYTGSIDTSVNDLSGKLKRQQISQNQRGLKTYHSPNARLPPRQDWKSKSLTVLDSVHSLIQLHEEKIYDDVTVKSGFSSANDTYHSSDSFSRPGSHQSSLPSSPMEGKQRQARKKLGGEASQISALTLLTQRRQSVKPNSASISAYPGSKPWDLSSQLSNTSLADPDKLNSFLDTLQEDGIFLGEHGVPLQNPNFFEKKKLDTIFYKNNSRASWGRSSGKVGVVRTQYTGNSGDSVNENDSKSGDDLTAQLQQQQQQQQAQKESSSPVKSFRSKVTGTLLLDNRTLPKLTSRTLTVKHPGLTAFHDSMSVKSTTITTAK